jgi:ankyrin repeat protein
MLVAVEADIDFQDCDNQKAVHVVASSNQADAIETLIELGADPEARDWRGRAILH